MNIIIVRNNSTQSRSLKLSGKGLFASLFFALLVVGSLSGFGTYQYLTADADGLFTRDTMATWRAQLQDQREELELIRANSMGQVDALSLRVAQLQSRLLRLDALGERMTTMAKLDKGEFDFSAPPALGGPESTELGDAYQQPRFVDVIDELTARIESREAQLEVLETLMGNRRLQDDVFIAGRPVKKGWMSSRFGRRTDPINGRLAWHRGVDFAGKAGSDVITVASGVVTWSGKRSGYGLLVEVNHGSGYVTRYGHNQESLVKVGDLIKKGQPIALMGSSGRSTGPHVHFEVFRNGKAVDPAKYIYRASR
ncbi:M23 family metallopeptidase [Aestuariirhabdus sp. Z084]|uniref:M23 family metallopeptidase n=1 Tax=Aestuariirhabdus haliotis TaxID=2918751 RepID=UPI00201B396D|nr:M23 family metallopeptidase [Aestuariirhabdus haliotis]MCL6415904.1 M23 family metallopeptidase [Aestuariirhabdus haliotis]MCL6419902.1 M23 family metallopeptidase [Aestuariirhabdus haliotis]